MIAKLIATIIQSDQQQQQRQQQQQQHLSDQNSNELSMGPFGMFSFKGDLQFDRLEEELQHVFVGQGTIYHQAIIKHFTY